MTRNSLREFAKVLKLETTTQTCEGSWQFSDLSEDTPKLYMEIKAELIQPPWKDPKIMSSSPELGSKTNSTKPACIAGAPAIWSIGFC